MKLKQDQIGGLFLLVFSTSYAALISDIPTIHSNESLTARSMPTALAALGILFGLGLLGRTKSSGANPFLGLDLRLGLGFLALMSGYALTIRPVGFILSTFVFLVAGFWLLGERRWLKNCFIAGVVVTVFWLLMTQVLSVYLPPWPERQHA